MLTLLLVLMSSGPAQVVAQGSDRVLVRVRAHADGGVDRAILRRARTVAEGLLDAAGLATTWRICDTQDACPPQDDPVPEAVVILSSQIRSNGDQCGLATLGPSVGEGTVLVSVPCVAGVAWRIAGRPVTRSHPMLAEGRFDDLVGAVVAHEIGHLLGMRHASTGLMRARLEADDIVALRLGRLGFSQPEAALMRARAQSARRSSDDRVRASSGPKTP